MRELALSSSKERHNIERRGGRKSLLRAITDVRDGRSREIMWLVLVEERKDWLSALGLAKAEEEGEEEGEEEK